MHEQINYVLDENELLGKGLNGTLSLVFNGIMQLNKGVLKFMDFNNMEQEVLWGVSEREILFPLHSCISFILRHTGYAFVT